MRVPGQQKITYRTEFENAELLNLSNFCIENYKNMLKLELKPQNNFFHELNESKRVGKQ